MEHNMVSKMSTLLRMGLVSKNNVRRATMLLQNPEKAMTNPAYRTLMQDILVDIMDRILNSKALYTAVRQNLVREPMITTEGVEEDRTKTLLRSGLVPKKDIMVARRALSSPAKAKSMATVRAYRELMIDLLDSMVGKITGSPTLYNAFKQTMGKQKAEDMEESFEQPNEDTIAELLLHETAQELMEKNKPTKPDLWAQAKSKAKSKFKVYPSAYANGWAVKWYNEQGGGWKSVNEGKTFFGLRDELDEAKWEGSAAQAALKKAKDDYKKHAAEISRTVPVSTPADRRKKRGTGTRRASDTDYRMDGVSEAFDGDKKPVMESEYKEVLTGYPNRGMNTDHGATDHRSTEFITQVNAVLKAIGRYTFHNPSEAFLRIKTRLNLLMLDFPWTPYAWSDGGTGTTVLNVTRYGRVDGVDANTGEVRMDGRASPTDGFLEFNLVAQTEMADDGFYRVTARLEPKSEIGLPLAVEEDYQTAAREREMDRKVQKHETKAQSGYTAKMTKSGKAAARGRRQEAKHDAALHRLLKRAEKEQDSPRTYGRGGKLIKRGSRAEVQEEVEVSEQWKSLKKTKADLDAIRASGKKVSVQHGEGDTLYRVSKAKKSVKEEAEQIEEMHKVGDTVKVPHKGKMVKGKIVRHDKGGSGKAAQHGGGYVVDVGEYSSITVPSHKIVKEETKKPWWEGKTQAELNAAAASASAARRGEEEEKRKRHAAHNKGKRFFNGSKWVKEELIGSQKRLDVNKNKKLDAQDFKLLRAKKKPVQEETVNEAKMKQWTPRLDKLFGSSRDAVRSKPKKSKILRKITPEPAAMPKAPAPKAKKKQSGSY